MPTPYTSVDRSHSPVVSSSGDMYSGVPSSPVVVPAPSATIRAMPKSVSRRSPGRSWRQCSVSSTLSGLMSRCRTPWSCALGEPVEDGRGDPDRQGGLQRAVVVQDVAQRAAVDVVHDDGQALALDHEVAHGDDVGVPQLGQDRALPDEAAHEVTVGDVLAAQQLRRDDLVGPPVDGAPDLAGGTAAAPLEQAVTGSEGVLEALRLHH